MKKWLALILVSALMMSVVAGCAAGTTGTTGTTGTSAAETTKTAATTAAGEITAAAGTTTKTTLNVSTYSDPQTLNPYQIDSRNGIRIYNQVYERLINRDATKPGSFVGILAESWKIADDGMSVTFNLRKGVKFHNGEEMKASDVVFSFKTMATFSQVTATADFLDFDNVKATDDYTVVIPLKYQCSMVMTQLAAANMVIVNEKWWTASGDKVSSTTCGTNKMMIKDGDYQLNNQITFTRFDGYWGTPSALETIIMRVIPESTQAAIELETGSLDLILDVAATDYQRIDESDTMQLMKFDSNVLDVLNFNVTDPIFGNVKVRQAMALAMNRDDIEAGVYMGWTRVPFAPIAPEVFAYTNEFEGTNWPYQYDVAKAKALLTEAGYPAGFTFDCYVDTDANRIKTAEILKNEFAEVGLTMNIVNIEGTALNDLLAKGKAPCWLYGIAAATSNPDSALFVRYSKVNAKDGGSNFSRYTNDEFSKCLDDARLTFDAAEQEALYKKAQEIWIGEVPAIPYNVRMNVVAGAKNLHGVVGYGEAYLLYDCYFS